MDKAYNKLKTERAALLTALKAEKAENERLKKDLADISGKSGRDQKKIAAATAMAAATESAKLNEYRLAVSALKVFIDKIERFSESGVSVKRKKQVTDILKGYLSEDCEFSDYKSIVENVSAALEGEETCENNFDLDAALSAGAELDLKELCEEFGVYKG